MTNELTVRVERPAIPAMSWNKEEVQKNLDEMLAAYTGRVYTPEAIKDAKADRATVNKWDKQLGDALRAAKKLYTDPLEEFSRDIRAMQAQCKTVSGAIDEQVKAVEQAQREEKEASLRLVYQDCIEELAPLIPFERLLVSQWLNKTYDLTKATKDLRQAIENIKSDMEAIRDTCGEDVEACTTEYLKNLSINEAMREHNRRERTRAAQREAEANRIAAERARAAAPVFVQPTAEEREMKARAAAATQAKVFITPEERLDFGAMQEAAAAEQPEAEEVPARSRYRFWVEFTAEDIAWFKQGAAQRGFRYGSIK